MSNNIGPTLPPHLQQKRESKESNTEERDKSSFHNIGPALPPWLQKNTGTQRPPIHSKEEKETVAVGPALPPWLKNKNSDEPEKKSNDGKEDTVSNIGPALPPWMEDRQTPEVRNDDENSFGPPLPPGFQQSNLEPQQSTYPNNADYLGDADSIIGPLPPSGNEDSLLSVAEQFEKRSKKMKDKLEGREAPKKLEREEWMTELPPLLQGFGTGPRKFRAKEKNEIGDRSVWTETPADKAKKAAQGKTSNSVPDEERIKQEASAKRDAEIAMKLSDKTSSERGESLMNIHEKARKRKLEEDQESGEANIRRPFDRELDLQTNKFDEAAKKRFIKKTQGLSSRFSSGSTTSKFL
ncbi:GPALPP motifs-containing protein 1-like isoform X1 [Styela clava]